jgi:hypothetical protein
LRLRGYQLAPNVHRRHRCLGLRTESANTLTYAECISFTRRKPFNRFIVGRKSVVHAVGDDVQIAQTEGPPGADAADDRHWVETTEVALKPHPALTEDQQKTVSVDFGMKKGVLHVKVKLAILYYFLRRLSVGTNLAFRPQGFALSRSPLDDQRIA